MARSDEITVPDGVRAAKDLAREEPRPFGLELEGYAYIPRMLDKARAALAGTAGRFQFGCPVDHTCMARLGVTPELVLDLAARHAHDADVLEALQRHGVPPAREAWFDAQAVEDELQRDDLYLRVRREEELPRARDGIGGVFAGDDHGAAVDVVLVTVAPDHGAGGAALSAAEVWVVQEGRARFFLGERQARIVRAGELVRIPAGVPWRLENTGEGTLRAVVARPVGSHVDPGSARSTHR